MELLLNPITDTTRETLPSPDSSGDSILPNGTYSCERGNTGLNDDTYVRQPYFIDQKTKLSFREIFHRGPSGFVLQPDIARFYGHGDFSIHREQGSRHRSDIYNFVNLNIPFSCYLANLTNTLNRSKTELQHISEKKVKLEEDSEGVEDVYRVKDLRKIDDELDFESEANLADSENLGDDSTKTGMEYSVNKMDPLLPQIQEGIPQYLHQYQVNSSKNPQSIHPIFLQLPELGRKQPVPRRMSTSRKYECDACGKTFSRSNTLVTHKVHFSNSIVFSVEKLWYTAMC